MIKTHKIPEDILERIDKAKVYLESHPKIVLHISLEALQKPDSAL